MFPEWLLLSAVRAGIYARISSDREGDGLGVARQIEDCERLAEQRGWRWSERYVDDDVSAWSGKPRPEYARMLEDFEAGAINAVLVCAPRPACIVSRSELEAFIELLRRAGV